jgi:hypothetical protein
MRFAQSSCRLLLLAIALGASPSPAAAARYYKMVPTEDAAAFRVGKILRPRFSKQLILQKHAVLIGKRSTQAGAATEQLFVETLERLRRSGQVPRSAPGRTEGVYVTTDLDRFPEFRDDPARSKLTLAPLDARRVATYDRRHFLAALRAMERARLSTGAEKARQLASARRHAERYYLDGVDLADPKSEPETLLGGGGRVLSVRLRQQP